MRFVIAKPTDEMSTTGDLFYSAQRKSEIDKAYDELIQICLRRADREFPRHPEYQGRNGMIPQVEKPLLSFKVARIPREKGMHSYFIIIAFPFAAVKKLRIHRILEIIKFAIKGATAI